MAKDLTIIAKIEAQTADFNKKIADSQKKIESMQKKIDGLTQKSKPAKSGLGGLASSVMKLGSAFIALEAVKKTIAFLTDSTAKYYEQAQAVGQLDAVLKSTNGTLGITSAELQDYASELQGVSLYGDEAIIKSEALLATFTKIGKGVFKEATATVLDMSQALGTDLKQSSIQLGKALNDPIKGISALSRNGVSFTQEQKNVIKALTETGDVAKAQKIILAELNSEFGGSAQAALRSAGGEWKSLSNTWGDAQEQLGSVADGIIHELIPAIKELIGFAQTAFGWIDKIFSITKKRKVKEEVGDLTNQLLNNATTLEKIKGTIPDEQFKLLSIALNGTGQEFRAVGAMAVNMGGTMKAAFEGLVLAQQDWEKQTLKNGKIYREMVNGLEDDNKNLIEYAKQNGVEAKKVYLTYKDIRKAIDETRKKDGTADLVSARRVLIEQYAEEKRKIKTVADEREKAKNKAIKATQDFIKAEKERVKQIKSGLGLTNKTNKDLDKELKTFLKVYKEKEKIITKDQDLIKKTRDYIKKNTEEWEQQGREVPKDLENVDKKLREINAELEFIKTNKDIKIEVEAPKDSDLFDWSEENQQKEINSGRDNISKLDPDPKGDGLKKWQKGIDYGRQFIGTLEDLGVVSEKTAEDLQNVANVAGGALKIAEGDYIGGALQLATGLAKVGESLGLWEGKKSGAEWVLNLIDQLGNSLGLTEKSTNAFKKHAEQIGELTEQYYKLREAQEGGLKSSDKWELSLLATVKTFKDVISASDVTRSNFEELASVGVKTFQALENATTDAEKAIALEALNDNVIAMLDKADELDLYSASIRRMFEGIEAGGYEATEAMKKLKEEFFETAKDYQKAQEVFHDLEIPALEKYVDLQEKITENQAMIDAIKGANEALALLGNTGQLTTEDFKAFDKQILDAFGGLIEAGFSQKDALEQIAPELVNLQNSAQDYNEELSEGVKWLLQTADAEGVVLDGQQKMKTEAEKANEFQNQQLSILEAIAKALGADIPEGFKKFKDGLKDVNKEAEKTRDTLEGIEMPDLNFERGGRNNGGATYNPDMPGFAEGTNGFKPISSLPSDFLVGEKGMESVSLRNGMIKINPKPFDDNLQGMKTNNYNLAVSFPNVNNSSNANDLINAINNNDFVINTLAEKLKQNAILNN